MSEVSGKMLSDAGLAMGHERRIAASYNALRGAINLAAATGFYYPGYHHDVSDGGVSNVGIIDAAAHILAKTNPELSAALCLESERMLQELAKEP